MAQIAVLALGLGAAVFTDVRTRRIPNWLTGAIVGAAFGLAFGGGPVTPMRALLGLVVGLALMLPGHVIGATGAGDVKLMAAVGAVVGPDVIFRVFLYSAVAGGVLAVVVALRRGRFNATLRATTNLVTQPVHAKRAIEAADRANRFAYGPAIAVGTFFSLVVHS
ncbi:MAG TPA: A24 family peptidase [Vicinamibacterales bacterium]|nr:A24 family peptidase [Vicinamibacterales bacterium]